MGKNTQNTSTPLHVVCIGGGYGAIYLVKSLRRAIQRGEILLTVVDRNNYHCFHGLAPEMLVGKIEPGNLLSSSRRIFHPAQFRNAEVESIDLQKRNITISRELDGRQFVIAYDHLVINAGSKEDLTQFHGIAEHTMRLKQYPDLLAVRHHVISMLELAEIETDPDERRRLLTFVVVGGNYAGVEVASAFSDFLPRIVRKNFPNLQPDTLRIVLVHSDEHLLSELGQHYPKLQAYAERVLASGLIEIRTQVRMKTATPDEAILENDERIPTRTIISCTGSAPSSIVHSLPFKKDGRHRLITDKYLNLVGETHVWACGDCAAVPHPDGGTCPPLAIWAMTAGRQVGKNIQRHIKGRDLRPYRFNGLGDACTLGNWCAVGHLKGIPLRGLVAYLIWRIFMIIYLPLLEKKVKTVWDWTIEFLFGPNLIAINLQQGLSIKPALYEAGQNIVCEGDIGHTLFVLRSGEVDVVENSPDGERYICTLVPGDHFGELAVFGDGRRKMTVRAKTRVEVVLLRGEGATALRQSLVGMGKEPWSAE